MSIRLYRWLQCLFPTRYRATFGGEMSVVYERALAEASARGTVWYAIFCAREFTGLIIAAFHERVWLAYSEQPVAAGIATRTFDSVPAFYTCESFLPRRGALVHGGLLSLLAFFGLCFAISHGRVAPTVLRALDQNHDGKLTADECGQGFEKAMDPQILQMGRRAFMRSHPVLAALDADHDGEISASEMQNAVAALETLDKNGDGKLVPAELFPEPPR